MSLSPAELYKQYEVLCESIEQSDRFGTEERILNERGLNSVQQFNLLRKLEARWPRPPKKPVKGLKPHVPDEGYENDHSDFVRRHLPIGGGR